MTAPAPAKGGGRHGAAFAAARSAADSRGRHGTRRARPADKAVAAALVFFSSPADPANRRLINASRVGIWGGKKNKGGGGRDKLRQGAGAVLVCLSARQRGGKATTPPRPPHHSAIAFLREARFNSCAPSDSSALAVFAAKLRAPPTPLPSNWHFKVNEECPIL